MKNRVLYGLRLSAAIIIFILAAAGGIGIFYPVRIFDIQFLPLLQRVLTDFSIAALILFILIAGLTFLCGRIYCSLICPFGILQELIGFIKGLFVKNRGLRQKNFPLKYFIAAIVWGIFIAGSACVIRYIEPYTAFSSAMSRSIFGLVLIVFTLIAVLISDRIFCTNFCPVGTVLGLISKISLNKIYISNECSSCGLCEKNCPAGCINSKEKSVDNETCIKCLKCITICPKNALKYGIKPKEEIKFSLKRRRIIIASTAAALFGIMVKAGLEIKDKIAEKVKDVILPAGAGNKERFLNKCLNCNLCVENCPAKIIAKADENYGAVHIDYTKGECKYDCNKCAEVCPSGAIKKLSLEEKQKTRIAMAMIKEDKCTKCTECISVCPAHAIIRTENNTPILNAAKCIGCGACKHACHFGAIEIFGVNEQRTL